MLEISTGGMSKFLDNNLKNRGQHRIPDCNNILFKQLI